MQLLDRILTVLEVIAAGEPQTTVSEMAARVGMSRSTTHRLLTSLLSYELIVRDANDKTYRLGPRSLQLAGRSATSPSLAELARPTMTSLRDEVGETVGLNVRHGVKRVVIDQVESVESLRRTYTDLGKPLPIHQGAPGKMLMATAPKEVQETILTGPLDRATDSTIVDSEELRQEITRVAKNGFAVSSGERVGGIHTVAAPVYDAQGNGIAALSVTGPASRFTDERVEAAIGPTQEAARHVSGLLGYSPKSVNGADR